MLSPEQLATKAPAPLACYVSTLNEYNIWLFYK